MIILKLYTKTICPKCILVKNTIERNELDVEIINIDSDEDGKQVLTNNGIMAVPVLEVNGKFITDVTEQLETLDEL